MSTSPSVADAGLFLYTVPMPSWVVALPDRLDAFLASDGRVRSRTSAQDAITQGRVTVNEEVVTKPAYRVQEGDVVEMEEAALSESDQIEPVDLHLQILYEDATCFVVSKPESLMVHPGLGMRPGEHTLLNGLAFLYSKWKLPFSAGHVLAHRLDKETTGALLCAKTPEAHLQLQQQFQDRTVSKFYLALVAGVPNPPQALIDAPIGRNAQQRTTMSVTQVTVARDARTTYRTLQSCNDVALLECELHTGRTHQIRVHLSSIGHPVLGDGTYSSELSDRLRDTYNFRHLFLHAWKLSFDSPAKGRVSVRCEPPEYWDATLEQLSLRRLS